MRMRMILLLVLIIEEEIVEMTIDLSSQSPSRVVQIKIKTILTITKKETTA